VVQAYDLTSAASAVESTAPDLRLILLDLNLGDTTYPESLLDNPFQGSFALAHEVRRSHPRLPIVIFSADWGTGIASAVQRVGAEFVFKRDCSENLKALRRRLELAPRSGIWTFL
jgi:DNA-binding NarL/FixJ family response regulator